MTSFIVTSLSNLLDYGPAKFQCCRLSLASFIDKLRKHNDDVIMTSFHVVRILKYQIL